MTLESHIVRTAQQAFFHLRNISRIKCYLDRSSLEMVCHSLITSKLDHCNSLYVGLPTVLTDRLQAVQDATAKMIMGKGKYDHTTPILKDLHWLPVKSRIQFKVLLLTYKCLHDQAPQYLKDLIVPYESTSSRSLRSSDKLLLRVPKTSMVTYGDRAFAVAAPSLWNELPFYIRSSGSVAKFKSKTKTYVSNCI